MSSRRPRTRRRKYRKTKHSNTRNISMKVNEFEKDLLDSLRNIENLDEFDAHHFGDQYVDEKLRNYGKSFIHNYKNVFKNFKKRRQYLNDDGNLIIEDDDGKRKRVFTPPKFNKYNDFKDFKRHMEKEGTNHSYSKTIEDDGHVRRVHINENGKETTYTEPSKFKNNNINTRAFFDNQSSFKSHKVGDSNFYSRKEHNDGEYLTITENIDGKERVTKQVSPSKNKNRKKRRKTRKRR